MTSGAGATQRSRTAGGGGSYRGGMTNTPGTLSVGARRVGPGERPLVIAELGINHDGDLDRMHRMIDDAADAGVECMKFYDLVHG